jgi:mutator protein MutT
MLIHDNSEHHELLEDEVEADENYFGAIRKVKFGRGAAGKVRVFGLLKRNSNVYTVFIPDAKTDTLMHIIRQKVKPDSIVYTDTWRSYNALDVSKFKHYRINHSDPKERLKQLKQVTAAIAVEEGKVLIARRGSDQKLAGFWEFPGDKLDPGESIFQCIEREIFEELSVKCIAKKVFSENVYEYEVGKINLITILVELQSRNFSLSVHDQILWCPIEKLYLQQLAPR